MAIASFMPQQHVDTPEIIYDTLVADTTFMALVGTTVFKNANTELDSISILTPGASLPAIKSQSGLEVIIHDVNELTRRDYITGEYDVVTTWKVFLLAWPSANGATLNSAARRIMELFRGASTIETNPVPSSLGAIAQLLTLIPSDSALPQEDYVEPVTNRLTTLAGDSLVTLDGRYLVHSDG